jgi:GMP synthase-like glutamine amidotransferase
MGGFPSAESRGTGPDSVAASAPHDAPGYAGMSRSEATSVRLHVVKHVPFEGAALVAEWAVERGYEISESLALTEQYPDTSDIDLVAVMGGPMAADDEAREPWLRAEKRWLAEALEATVPVFGVCLGAQVLACVVGGRVRRNDEPEIGWFPVRRTAAATGSSCFAGWPQELVVGHWHGDTFELPAGSKTLLSSEACANQAFEVDGHALGLQFHVEWDAAALDRLIDECSGELVASPYVMDAASLRRGVTAFGPACRSAMWALLDSWAAGSASA